MKRLITVSLFFIYSFTVICQEVIPLYGDSIPNSKPTKNEESETINNGILIINKITVPTLTVFLPPENKANGTAVIICPGGGYWILAAGHEGFDVAKKFNEMGVAAFVLKYRIPSTATMINKELGPLQDAQRAIQIVRENAKKWNIKKDHVGIMGFSAGGHLAATIGTHFQHNYTDNKQKVNLRPDFMILVYPVISFRDSIGHIGSRDQLIGAKPSQKKIKEYSNEYHVNTRTPPAFLVHAKDDKAVKVQNSTMLAAALKKNKIPHGIYLYEKGGHGFGMINPTSEVRWMDEVQKWMKKFQL